MKGGEVLGCVGLIPATIFGCVLRAWVLVQAWDWFITPVFHVPAPGLAAAVGIALTINLFLPEGASTPSSESESLGDVLMGAYGKLLFSPFISLGFAWLVHQFM